jgi:hypothetical protein
MKRISDFFAAFDERAGEPARRREDDESYGGVSSGFCLGALVIAVGYALSAGAASAASPF